ncbi:MAG: ArsA-related P-loop ATPase, partial [Ilumatobacter sp.]
MSGVEQRSDVQGIHSLADVVEHSELILTCGPGGVGKTTTAAALGVAAARSGRKVVVVTVDPARRLADALGLDDSAEADEPHLVPGVTKRATDGELWALMLDAEQTFDRLVREQAGSRKQADAVLNNPVYQAISGSLSGAQEYMAVERLHQLHVSGEWDLVIVDTPASRHAIGL